MGPTVYYIRHGQTDWNAELRFQGQRDIPLNAHGMSQAKANGQKLKALIADKPDIPFICSPMTRTRQTMSEIQAECGIAPENYTIDERLIEACYGDWEGQTLQEIKAKFPALHKQRKAERWTFAPPNGESHKVLEARVSDWFESLTEDSVVVAHGVVGRVVRYLLLDIDPQAAGEFVFPQDKICEIKRGQEIFH